MNPHAAKSDKHHRRGFQLLSESSYPEALEQFLKAMKRTRTGQRHTWVSDKHTFSKEILTWA
jgi:hypothetical protein